MIYFKEKLQKGEGVNEFFTRILEGDGRLPETYSDKECTILQCKSAYRSLDAILEIKDTYFPEMSVKDFLASLPKFLTRYCSDVKKLTFSFIGYVDNRHHVNEYEKIIRNSAKDVKIVEKLDTDIKIIWQE